MCFLIFLDFLFVFQNITDSLIKSIVFDCFQENVIFGDFDVFHRFQNIKDSLIKPTSFSSFSRTFDFLAFLVVC